MAICWGDFILGTVVGVVLTLGISAIVVYVTAQMNKRSDL